MGIIDLVWPWSHWQSVRSAILATAGLVVIVVVMMTVLFSASFLSFLFVLLSLCYHYKFCTNMFLTQTVCLFCMYSVFLVYLRCCVMFHICCVVHIDMSDTSRHWLSEAEQSGSQEPRFVPVTQSLHFGSTQETQRAWTAQLQEGRTAEIVSKLPI